MKEYTDEEIIKGLMCCALQCECETCPAYSEENFDKDNYSMCHELMACAGSRMMEMKIKLAEARP